MLTQEAVYGTLLAGRKTQLHRQAGEAIEALYADSLAEHYEALAHHYDRSDANDKAVEYLLKAGEKARRAYLSDEAIGYFERAWRGWIGQTLTLVPRRQQATRRGWPRSPGWGRCIRGRALDRGGRMAATGHQRWADK